MSTTTEGVALVCLVWYIFIILVCTIGTFQLFRHYSTTPEKSVSAHELPKNDVPHVTVIRPCKGVEPYLYECLASTFYQDYPRDKLTLFLCVSSRNDPAFPVLQNILQEFGPHHGGRGYDLRVLVEEEDPVLYPELIRENKRSDHEREHEAVMNRSEVLGPNPKIRNMSRAYREAKGDIVWIIDCNVWVNSGACGRMVDKLCGFTKTSLHGEIKLKTQRPYKFVHQLPIAVNVDEDDMRSVHGRALPSLQSPRTKAGEGAVMSHDEPLTVPVPNTLVRIVSSINDAANQKENHYFGSRLEELFLSSSHAKMYTAINVVAVAPCIVGKSNMFRRSHLNMLTNRDESPETRVGSGIDHFSRNICEDHLIGDLLWKSKLPDHTPPDVSVTSKAPELHKKLKWRNHGLVTGDLAIQPISRMSLANYVARRVRWLRVRKFTVPVATLVEPGTESFVCSAMGVWGMMNCKYTRDWFRDSEQTQDAPAAVYWPVMLSLWLTSVTLWALWDRQVRKLLFSGRTIESGGSASMSSSRQRKENQMSSLPPFVHPQHTPFFTWLSSWLGREALALPVWTWAIWGGVSVTWREKRFWVGLDMKVHEYKDNLTNNDHANQEKMTAGEARTVRHREANGSAVLENGGLAQRKKGEKRTKNS